MQAFTDIIHRIDKKLTRWKAKILSQAGRTMLIRSVAFAIPMYSMSFFVLPQMLCKKIDCNFRQFWWGYKSDHTLNIPLLAVGGLGICLMAKTNLALLSKLAWMMTTSNQHPLDRCLKSKYLKRTEFLQPESKSPSSWFWKGLLKVRPLFPVVIAFWSTMDSGASMIKPRRLPEAPKIGRPKLLILLNI